MDTPFLFWLVLGALLAATFGFLAGKALVARR